MLGLRATGPWATASFGAVSTMLAASPLAAQTYAISHVTVIDGRGGAPLPDRTVIVERGRIRSLRRAAAGAATPGAVAIDGRGKFLIPGLIDAHIHLRDTGPDGRKRTMTNAAAEAALAGYIARGFTTVADLGNASPEGLQIVQAAELSGRIASPHLLIAGRLFTAPGGKSEEIGLAIASADPATLARHAATDRPDIVKLVHDSGGYGGQPVVPSLSPGLMRTIIRDAHRRGLRAVVHIAREREAREAIAAGADGLAHPVWVEAESKDFARLMARRRIPFATTLAVADQSWRAVDPTGGKPLDPRLSFAAWRRRSYPVEAANIVRIVKAGGVAALGTDMASGSAAQSEMRLLVAAGIAPIEVIRIATLNAAIFLGRDRDRGTIERGKRADLVLLNRDPTRDIEALADIALVMRDGKPVDRAPTETVPEDIQR